MKSILLFLLILVFNLNFSQSFNEKEMRRLEKLSIPNTVLSNPNNTAALEKIIITDKYRKANKIWGYVFAGLGTIATASGIFFIRYSDRDFGYLAQMMGISSFVVGGLSFGGSTLFFIRSRNEKRETDELINLYKNPD